MNHRIAGRLRSVARTRGVLGLLAVLTLNMVVLPCAMAFGLDDHDCPHCPPAEQHEMAGHHGHEQTASAPCAEVQAQCCEIAAASIDTRSGKLEARDAGGAEAVPVAEVVYPIRPFVAYAEPVPRPPDLPGTSPPRHKLNCVYLD